MKLKTNEILGVKYNLVLLL